MTGLLDSTEALEEARGAASRALQIDETLAEAHSALAHTYAVEWNWASASREFSHALQLDPALTVGNPCHYVEFLMAVKDPKQASLEIERIPVARPLSSFWSAMIGWAHYGNRDYDRAIREHQAVVKNHPRHAMTHLLLALNYSQTGQYKNALAECRKVLSLGKLRLALNALGYVYAAGGERDRAKEILAQLRRMLRTSAASS
jgi:tetratricopeptide (TPR) repeat protein